MSKAADEEFEVWAIQAIEDGLSHNCLLFAVVKDGDIQSVGVRLDHESLAA